MCGILYLFGVDDPNSDYVKQQWLKIRHRGPDLSRAEIVDGQFFGFHRLAINDLTEGGMQPMHFSIDGFDYVLMCNGEIFNFHELAEKHFIPLKSSCDIEIVPHLVHRYGLKTACSMFDGVFVFCLYCRQTKQLFVGRDAFGVRPLFVGRQDSRMLAFCSEMKGIHGFPQLDIQQFPNGHCATYSLADGVVTAVVEPTPWYAFQYVPLPVLADEEIACCAIRVALTKAVQKRMLSDRKVGCLLSGGLDSSIVCSLVHRFWSDTHPGEPLETFSIGMEGAVDLRFARIVANFLGTKHHDIVLTEQQFLDAIPEVIGKIESYDTTTVRASVGNYLVSKYIKENSDCTVIFNGDGSDEAFLSYLYGQNAPSDFAFEQETIRLLKDICYFDVLRSDRSICTNGLEPRTPFLDKAFIESVLSIPVSLRRSAMCEKYLLRKAFDDGTYLPLEVLWRQKEAFSDGVSSQKKPWFKVIQEQVAQDKCDQFLHHMRDIVKHNPPALLETAFYCSIFQSLYEGREHVIPYYWLPKWCGDIQDPSARLLNHYDNSVE